MLIPTNLMECSDEETVVTGNMLHVRANNSHTEATAPIIDDEYQSDSSFEQESSSEGKDILALLGGSAWTSEGGSVFALEGEYRPSKVRRKWLRKLTNRQSRKAEAQKDKIR